VVPFCNDSPSVISLHAAMCQASPATLLKRLVQPLPDDENLDRLIGDVELDTVAVELKLRGPPGPRVAQAAVLSRRVC
jgi:hypothetical protein